MKLRAINTFHRTETLIEVVEVFTTKTGKVAVIRPEELNRVARKLCGSRECSCNPIAGVTDDKGFLYHPITP